MAWRSAREVGLDSLFDGRETNLLESRDFGRKGFVGELHQRGAAPEGKRLRQPCGRLLGMSG